VGYAGSRSVVYARRKRRRHAAAGGDGIGGGCIIEYTASREFTS